MGTQLLSLVGARRKYPSVRPCNAWTLLPGMRHLTRLLHHPVSRPSSTREPPADPRVNDHLRTRRQAWKAPCRAWTSPPLQVEATATSCSPRTSLPCVSTLCESVLLACSAACREPLVYW